MGEVSDQAAPRAAGLTDNFEEERPSSPTSGYTPRGTESSVSKRYLPTHVQSNIIQNSQEVKATQMSADV